ncbi:MAG TPA: Arm DNA-binding domain-containing protein, partial [Candidatus Binatia bacterium]|nr:Arm DNA-binding domain-containing protein [Candidatus Binatia bacterium]
MPLTDIKIRSAKPQHKTYKLFDGGGLYLEVTTS